MQQIPEEKITIPIKNSIGIFDSGVGGLSVFNEIRRKLPNHPILYFADQFHVPYGPRKLEEVFSLSSVITNFLFELGAEIIVIACNAASAASLYPLRDLHPLKPFVGMEPAVKPAVEKTHTGSVGVLATPATFQGKLYNSVVERFAKNVKIYQNTCKGLVQEIEQGNLNGKTTRKILSDALKPMLEKGIDTVVLGCTHYPFVIPAIEDIVGPNVTVIDPSPAIANQTFRKINEFNILNESNEAGKSLLITTGSLKKFKIFVDQVDLNLENIEFRKAIWSEDKRQINFIQE